MSLSFRLRHELVVSSKRYDDTKVDIDDIDKRSALQELFCDIKAGLVDTVVIYSLHTLSESFKIITEIMKVFKQHNLRIIVAGQNIDTATPSGRRTFLRISDLAQFESIEDKQYFNLNKQDER